MTKPASKPYVLRASIDSRSLPIELFGSGPSRHQRKLVFNYICTYANPDGSSACPSLTTIARDNGLSRRGVIGIIEWLEEHHLLAKSDERSRFNTNNYTALFSPEDQERCREALLKDAKEQEVSGRAKRTRESRVLGGKRAAAKRKGSERQHSLAESTNGEREHSLSASEYSIHQGSECGAQMVNAEHVNGEYLRSHDRPYLPSVESPLPSYLPSRTSAGRQDRRSQLMPKISDKVLRVLGDCLRKKSVRRSTPDKSQESAFRTELESHGVRNIALAFVMFLDRPKGVTSLQDPWGHFLRELPDYLRDVEKEAENSFFTPKGLLEDLWFELFQFATPETDRLREAVEGLLNDSENKAVSTALVPAVEVVGGLIQ